MRPARRLFPALLALSTLTPLALTTPPALAAPPAAVRPSVDTEHGLDPALAAQLDQAIEKVRQGAGIPGVTVGLWLPGRGAYVHSAGIADKVTGAPMRSDFNQRIGSVTKTFTATAVLELVDGGLVGLDDPICDYIDGVPDGEHITIRQIAEMRSGLYSYTFDPDFQQALFTDPTRPFTPQELLAYAFKHDNVFAPGANFQYSNTNYVLLGLLVEKVSGKPLADFIRERVTGPSHLDRTFLPAGAEFPDPHARGYSNQTLTGAVEDVTDWNPSWGWAAGAMISDLQDLRHWARILATGTLLSPETQKQRENFVPVPGFPDAGYGLGLFTTHGWVGHNGSLPGYEDVVMYLPEQHATMVVMLNTDIVAQGEEPSTLIARAVTQIVTPGNVYDLPKEK
ncbi:serine hydrolase domain-containing protein [Kitasatospora sp. NPDC002227]|uniref:serine hydrolase domain-containing protein n=1 Tax=Kitasatospora sp. NPDC002227 TaxID=3154773 RepID=UPI00331F3003